MFHSKSSDLVHVRESMVIESHIAGFMCISNNLLVIKSDFKLEGLTSTPNMVTSLQRTDIPSPFQPVCEGSFVGRAKHKDGSPLGIIYQVQ